uniref:Uncharacterized protein n=1 Tax=Arundo donax TaxID=35708 RepID=A0A0A9FAS9_ARUDO
MILSLTSIVSIFDLDVTTRISSRYRAAYTLTGL